MNANIETLPVAPTASTKPLWAAVGVLGVAVLALGGGMVYMQSRNAPAPAPSVATVATSATDAAPASIAATESTLQQDEVLLEPSRPPAVAAKPAKPKPAPVASRSSPAVTSAPAANPAPVVVLNQPAVRPICANCGTIETVTPIQRKGEAKGVGAVAGGVLGAVVGNQIGHGGGRTAATVLGALGGGYAGNAIEKNVRKETVYQVRVRMEDGSTRTFEQASMPPVGGHVVVESGALRAADGSWSAPAPVPVRAPPTLQSTPGSERG